MKHEKLHTTNAMRLLTTAGIPFKTATYQVDEDDLSGMHVAKQLGQDPHQLFKTLVLTGEKQPFIVCCIPTAFELDLKKTARAAGDKRVEMLPLARLLAVTGYVRGGCSPLAMKKQFPTYIDEIALMFDEIYISAGERGEQIIVNPEALATLIDASFADLVAGL